MKTCRKCHQEKSSAEFYRAARMKDGLHSWCKQCLNDRAMERYRNRDEREQARRLSANRLWRKKNAERVKDYNKQWHAKNRDEQIKVMWRRRLKRKYELTADQFATMRAGQDDRCAICREAGELVVDHDHETDSIRGLLCQSCNKALGFFRDSEQRLHDAADYLRRSRTVRLSA